MVSCETLQAIPGARSHRRAVADDGIELSYSGRLGCALRWPRVERPLAAKESEWSPPTSVGVHVPAGRAPRLLLKAEIFANGRDALPVRSIHDSLCAGRR